MLYSVIKVLHLQVVESENCRKVYAQFVFNVSYRCQILPATVARRCQSMVLIDHVAHFERSRNSLSPRYAVRSFVVSDPNAPKMFLIASAAL